MSTPSFTLTVNGIALTLVEFDGREEMNRLFSYTFKCEAPSGKKLVDVLDGDALFTIKEYDTSIYTGDLEISGYISAASKSSSAWILEFHPKLHKATTNSRSEIYFQEDGLLDIDSVLQSEFQNDILLNERSAVFNIGGSLPLPQRKLFCQFHESNWNYVARMCDHWGFHFYFDHFNSQLVFADDNQYDQTINTGLKTTASTADNTHIKLLSWSETQSLAQNYTKITGYDPQNAATPIIATYPSSTGSLTEVSLTMSDVNSQDEADYIAQVRDESRNCKNHKATAKTKLPYLIPGLTIDTDDSDFSKALVIKSTSRGRNLNSANSGTAASYECDIELIPSTVLFRPLPSYNQPSATNVVGKVISEANDSTTAQRNTAGEYKIELLGFENETSVNPWVRKAQTTAGTNSVDLPLTPDTEVLIAFVDNNPNCPYIQHALDNSLHPAPVTNANPHHAVIKTDGMLVTSSATGRFNFSTTKDHERTDDASIGSSVKNYLTGRGPFNQNKNFIDPSADAEVFTFQDADSGEYITTRHYGDSVEIREGDKLHWHNGNLYDFGGYWNYNLGNSYEENFIDQESPLNIKVQKDSRTGDILTNTGPDWSSINFDSLKQGGLATSDVTPASYGDTAIATDKTGKTFKVNTGGEWNSGGMNVTKDYNASYDYKFGEGIEVSDRVNSLEVTHTDGSTESIELNYHKGVLRSWEKTVGRNSWSKSWAGNGDKTSESSSKFDSDTNTKTEKEKTWDVKGDTKTSETTTTTTPNSITTDAKSYNMNTGALAAHNITKSDGMGSSVMDFSYSESNVAEFSFGGERKLSISAQGTATLAASFSGNASIALEVGLNLNVKLSAGMTIEMEKDAAGKIEVNNKKLEYSGTGVTARIATGIAAKSESLTAAQKKTELESFIIKLAETKLDLSKNGVRIGSCVVDLQGL